MGIKAMATVLPCMKPWHFVNYILHHQAMHATVVICSTRESFLEEMYASTSDVDGNEDGNDGAALLLLVPTIHQLAISCTINLVFAPTLAHVRAYLATYESNDSNTGLDSQSSTRNQNKVIPILAIFGMLHLHRCTSEYSAQGVSRTFAIAVESATTASRRLVVVEAPGTATSEEFMPATESDTVVASDPWKDQVPLLNGSTRFGREDRIWAGRTVEAARIASRWCTFAQLDTEVYG